MRFSTVTIFVVAMICINVIPLRSIATHLLYAQPDNNQLTVHKLIASFPFIPIITNPNQTMGRSVPAISNVSQSSTNQTPSNGNSTFLTYKNPIYGIQIQYPSTWIKVANQGHEIVRFISPPGVASLGIIARTGASQLIPLQVYVNAGIDVLKKIFSGFNLISSNVTTLGGVPAQKIVYTASLTPGLKLKFLQYFAIRDNMSYVITSGALPGDFATYLPTLQRMISSLSFISPTSLSSPNGTVPTSNQTALNATNSISSLQQVPKSVPFGSSSNNNNTYTNSTDGISFNIPQRWTIEEGYNQANATLLTVVTVSPPIALDPSALMQVIIEKDTNPLTSSIDQYLRDQLNSYRNNPSNNFKLISANTNTTLSGQPAYGLLFTYTPHVSYAGPLSEHLEVGTLLNGQAYIIDYYGSKDLFSKFLPQVKQIVESFKINRPAEQKQSQAVTTSNVTTLVDKGNGMFNHDNYAQALQYFNKALAIDPNDKVALTGKGESLDNLGNYTQAMPYLDKALSIDPNDKVALTGKGESFNGLGNYTEAIPYLDKALTIDPNYKVALNDKGAALGNYTQAIQYYDKALAIDPNYKEALDNKANALYTLGNYSQAIPYLDKALSIDPNFKAALTGKGYVLNSLGNYSQAIPYLDKVLAMDPNNKDALTGKGDSLNGLGNYTQAIPYLDKALAMDPNYQEALASKGDSLDNLRNYSQAIPYLDKALAIDPNDKIALNDKGYALSGLGNYTQAIQYYDKALAIDPNYKIALDNKQAALSKMSPPQQQNIRESTAGPAPSPSPYAAFNSSGLVCHYKSQSRNLYCAMRR